jgi:hypothetical protein
MQIVVLVVVGLGQAVDIGRRKRGIEKAFTSLDHSCPYASIANND